MRVEDIAKKTGISPHTVRDYHKLGLLETERDPFNR